MLSHNSAMYHPTLRQVPQDQVLALAVQGIKFDDAAWTSWGAQGLTASVPLFEAREDLAGRLAASSNGAVHHITTYVVQKKPAQKKPAGTVQVVKKVKAGKKVSTKPQQHNRIYFDRKQHHQNFNVFVWRHQLLLASPTRSCGLHMHVLSFCGK